MRHTQQQECISLTVRHRTMAPTNPKPSALHISARPVVLPVAPAVPHDMGCFRIPSNTVYHAAPTSQKPHQSPDDHRVYQRISCRVLVLGLDPRVHDLHRSRMVRLFSPLLRPATGLFCQPWSRHDDRAVFDQVRTQSLTRVIADLFLCQTNCVPSLGHHMGLLHLYIFHQRICIQCCLAR